MPKVDPESGEPMSDDPEGPEDTAGAESIDPREQGSPDDPNAGGGGS
ncbi:MAG: hypothetical protein WKF86_06075 [Acidimicrobiales bacterium]